MRTFVLVLHVLGLVVMLLGLTMLVPAGVAWYEKEPGVMVYAESFLITFLSGTVLYVGTRRTVLRAKREMLPRDGFLLVTLVWTVLPLFATLPLLLSLPTLTFNHAYFEAVSGLTTTGATILKGLDHLPASINTWRCLLVWEGGFAMLLLAVAVLPLLGVGASQIYKIETPGAMKESKLTPRLKGSARSLFVVYLGISIVCLLSMRAAGMSWLDAFCHSASTMGLGAFSTHDASFGYFNSFKIELVAVFFMCLAGLNFSAHFLAWRYKSIRGYFRYPETIWFLGALIAGVALVTYYLFMTGTYPGVGPAFRYALFNTVSMATTTGFSTTDFNRWPIFAPTLMLLLCTFASCAGSAGGGIKMVRALLLLKQARRELTRILHPRAINPVRFSGEIVENKVIFSVLAFMLMYGVVVITCTMLLLFSGLDVVSAFTAIIATINNAGPGLAQVGPASTYAGLSEFQLWVCIVAMLLGRLELFTILVIFTSAFWKK